MAENEVLLKHVKSWLEQIWKFYDEDNDDNLNAAEARKLLVSFTGSSVTEIECEEFLQSIDEDDDALIQIEELQHFVSRGIVLSDANRKTYATRGSVHRIILEFFDVCAARLANYEEMSSLCPFIKPWLQKIWLYYDMDKDDHLNAKETKVLLEKFTGHDADEDKVRQFLQNIDEDGDALIQLDELYHFIQKGITLSNEARKSYSSRGPLQRTILEFFDGAIEKLRVEKSKEGLLKYTDSWLADIFPLYDEDNDGALNPVEISQVLREFTGHEVDEEQCKKFLQSVDEDGNALIEMNELKAFVNRGISLSEEERDQYSSRGGLHQTIVEFFDHCLAQLKKLQSKDEFQKEVEEDIVDKKQIEGKTDVDETEGNDRKVSQSPISNAAAMSVEELGTTSDEDMKANAEEPRNFAATPKITADFDYMSTFDESKYSDSIVVPKDFEGKMRMYEKRLKEATEIAGEGSIASEDACAELVTLYNQYALHLLQEEQSSLADINKAELLLKKAMILSRPSDLLPTAETQYRLRSTTLNNKAILYKAKKMPHAALQCLDKALQVECRMANCPNPAGTHLNLCVTLSDIGRHRAALTHAKCAIKLIEYEIKGREGRIDNLPMNMSYGEKMNETYENYPTKNPSSPKRAAIISDDKPSSLHAIAYFNKACQEEHLGLRSKAAVTFQKALSIANEDRDANSSLIEQIQLSLRGSIFKVANKEMKAAGKTKKASPGSPKSTTASPKRIERPVNSQDELNIILRKAVDANRSLFGIKLRSPVDVFLAIDKDDSGTIDFDELKRGLKRLGMILTESGMKEIMNAFDPEETGVIRYDQWVTQVNKKFEKKESKRHSSTFGHRVVKRSTILESQRAKKLEALESALAKSGKK